MNEVTENSISNIFKEILIAIVIVPAGLMYAAISTVVSLIIGVLMLAVTFWPYILGGVVGYFGWGFIKTLM